MEQRRDLQSLHSTNWKTQAATKEPSEGFAPFLLVALGPGTLLMLRKCLQDERAGVV